SIRSGQFESLVSQPVSTDAASIGRTAFFAPCTEAVPQRRLPPLMCHISMISPPHSQNSLHTMRSSMFVSELFTGGNTDDYRGNFLCCPGVALSQHVFGHGFQ